MSTYVPPIITAAGLSIPNYEAVLQDNLAQYQHIYGANQYVGVDSAIYQLLAILSLKMNDTLQCLQLVYNNQSPATAVGAGLDRIVELNGIARLPATNSTVELNLTGTPNAVITNGAAADTSGNTWTLPTSVTLSPSGTATTTGTCTTSGNVTAEVGTVTTIATPQPGWASVTNPIAALPGTAIEADSQLRARQAISTAAPSHTMLQSLTSAVAAVPGVTRYNVIENYTSVTDPVTGLPPHSICATVEGGDATAVATAIYNQRGIGVATYGSTSVSITDPNSGNVMVINFNHLTGSGPGYVPIWVTVQYHILNTQTFTSAMPGAMQTAIVNYLNSLQIGETVVQSALVAATMAVTPNIDEPAFSIYELFLGTSSSPTSESDIPMIFSQVAQGITANVVVTQV